MADLVKLPFNFNFFFFFGKRMLDWKLILFVSTWQILKNLLLLTSILKRMSSSLRSSKRIKNGVESVLPDEMFFEILLRVPAKDVLRYRCVCIRWNKLTSTQDFIDQHSRRSLPVILTEDPHKEKWHLNTKVLFDKWWELARTKSVIHKLKIRPDYRIYFSQAGFVVFQSQYGGCLSEFIVQNPLFLEEVRIVIPKRFWVQVYGIFFHRVLNEYCLLLGVSLPPLRKPVQYKLLNLGSSEPCWRGLNSQWCHRPKDSLSCSVFIHNQYLYWMVVFEEGVEMGENGHFDIMEFDTISEVFRLLPCPETYGGCGFNVNLISVDSLLSFVKISLVEALFVISIWTLKDRVEQLWISSQYFVKDEGYSGHNMQALALVDNQLVVRSVCKLFVCNLESGISRNFVKKNYNRDAQFMSHVMMLATLKNCKTRIYLEDCEQAEAKTKNCLASYNRSLLLSLQSDKGKNVHTP